MTSTHGFRRAQRSRTRASTTRAALTRRSITGATNGKIARDARAPGEDFIDDRFGLDLRHRVQVDAEVSGPVHNNRRQRRAALRSRGHRVPPGRTLTFRIVDTDVPQPYEIRWKVRNRGPVAKAKACERGCIFVGGEEHVEPTAFKGPHYVECYIIKDGVCVAAAHVPVNILFTQ